MDSEVVSLRELVAGLRRRWRVVALATLGAVGVALAAAALQTPKYLSEAQILLEPLGQTADAPQPALEPEEIGTQIEVVTSLPVAADVADAVDPALSAEELLDLVTVSVIPDTHVLTISVLHADPRQARNIANAFAESYLAQRQAQEAQRVTELRALYARQLARITARLEAVTEQLRTATPAERAALQTTQLSLQSQADALSTQLGALTLAGGAVDSGGVILQQATTSNSPASPQPVRMAGLGLVLGLMLGIALALTRDRFDDVVRDETRLREVLGGRQVLASIPRSPQASTGRVETVVDPESPVSDAYRALSTTIRFLLAAPSSEPDSGRAERKIVLVASAAADEGRTAVATNLAVAAARVGLSVVLVDGDLRDPEVSGRFALEGSDGLAELSAGQGSPASHLVDVGIGKLRILTAGRVPPNPTELLASPATRDILVKQAEAADLVVMDSAPLVPVADTLELVRLADLVLMVAMPGTSRLRTLSAAVERIHQVGGSVEGWVLNRVD